jgi:hypothetical protein
VLLYVASPRQEPLGPQELQGPNDGMEGNASVARNATKKSTITGEACFYGDSRIANHKVVFHFR